MRDGGRTAGPRRPARPLTEYAPNKLRRITCTERRHVDEHWAGSIAGYAGSRSASWSGHHNTAEDDEAIGRAMEYLRASVVPQEWIEREIPWLIARGDDSDVPEAVACVEDG